MNLSECKDIEKERENKNSDNEEIINQKQYKLIILGDGAVGKTSIALRHTDDHFSSVYKQTIGVDFFLKRLILPGDMHVALQIWDIGGQTIGGKMLKNYIYGANVLYNAVILAYDITNYESFQNLEDWFRLVRRTFQEGKNQPYVALIGNKSDLEHMRAVTLENHNQFAEENGLHSYFMSAKTGDEVHSTFFKIAADLSGIILTKPEIQVSTAVVKAHIVNHEQNDPEIKAPEIRRNKGKCSIQ